MKAYGYTRPLVWFVFAMAVLMSLTLAGETHHNAEFPPVDSSMQAYGNQRLRAIAVGTNMLQKLDQKHCFSSEQRYQDVLKMTLRLAEGLLPSVFQKREGMVFAVCPADMRVFFAQHRDAYSLVGAIPIYNKDVATEVEKPVPDTLVFWGIVRTNAPSATRDAWNNLQAKPDDEGPWKVIMKAMFSIEPKRSNVVEQGNVLPARQFTFIVRHSLQDITARLSTNVIQCEFNIATNYGRPGPGKVVLRADDVPYVKDLANLPFPWPPEQGK